jgi:hypothetical protein
MDRAIRLGGVVVAEPRVRGRKPSRHLASLSSRPQSAQRAQGRAKYPEKRRILRHFSMEPRWRGSESKKRRAIDRLACCGRNSD